MSELGFVGLAGLRTGCELISGVAVGAGFKVGWFERVGIVQALGGVGDFDGGEGVTRVVVEGDRVGGETLHGVGLDMA